MFRAREKKPGLIFAAKMQLGHACFTINMLTRPEEKAGKSSEKNGGRRKVGENWENGGGMRGSCPVIVEFVVSVVWLDVQ